MKLMKQLDSFLGSKTKLFPKYLFLHCRNIDEIFSYIFFCVRRMGKSNEIDETVRFVFGF
jgi:hypothetical protein